MVERKQRSGKRMRGIEGEWKAGREREERSLNREREIDDMEMTAIDRD